MFAGGSCWAISAGEPEDEEYPSKRFLAGEVIRINAVLEEFPTKFTVKGLSEVLRCKPLGISMQDNH